MPTPSNNPQWAAELRNVAEVQGKVGLNVDEIVVPTVDVGGDFPELPWNGVAGGWCWGGRTSAQPAPAGRNAFLWLHNPTGSGVIARVYRCAVNLEAGALAIQQTAAFGVTTSVIINSVTARRVCDLRRSRRIGGQDTVLELHEAVDQAGPLTNPQRLVSLQAPANGADRYDFETHIILPEGTSLVVAAQQADQRISAWFQWEERIVRAAERVIRQP